MGTNSPKDNKLPVLFQPYLLHAGHVCDISIPTVLCIATCYRIEMYFKTLKSKWSNERQEDFIRYEKFPPGKIMTKLHENDRYIYTTAGFSNPEFDLYTSYTGSPTVQD